MAQLNLTITQEEMQALLQQDQSAAFRELLKECLNSILQAESAEQLKAAPYERTEARTDSRNGSRERTLNTRIGQIVLQVPRHREVPFKTLVFENYSRSERRIDYHDGRDGGEWDIEPEGREGNGDAVRESLFQIHSVGCL